MHHQASEDGQHANGVQSATGAEDKVEILDRNVAETVMGVLHCYYPDAEQFKGETKICNSCSYTRMTEIWTHRLREEIKESYRDFHDGGHQGIIFTRDMKHYVTTMVEVEMDKIPRL